MSDDLSCADESDEPLLEQLDRMQDEVLQGLDDLDARIMALIKECNAANARELSLTPGQDHAEAA